MFNNQDFDRLIIAVVVACIIALIWQSAARAHWRPGYHNVQHAVKMYFGSHWYDAMRVVRCETGGTYSVWAQNGQYRGLFQMGSWERRTYGHGNNPWAQARAAAAYFRASGSDWSPWECKPWR